MAWRRPGDKPLSEPMMVILPTHIYASLGLNELKQCSAGPVILHKFSHKYSQKTLHGSPVRLRYGVSFVDSASTWYSASVPTIVSMQYLTILDRVKTALYIQHNCHTFYKILLSYRLLETKFNVILIEIKTFSLKIIISKICISKCRLQNGSNYILGSMCSVLDESKMKVPSSLYYRKKHG